MACIHTRNEGELWLGSDVNPFFNIPIQLANWLEFYADSLELNVWTSSTVKKVEQDSSTSKWHVSITRGDGSERKLVVNHVVFCTGIGSGVPNIPDIPGRVSALISFNCFNDVFVLIPCRRE